MVEVKRRGSNDDVIRNRYGGLGDSGYPKSDTVREGARPLTHETRIYQSAHMSSEPYTSLLNQGHSRQRYGGRK